MCRSYALKTMYLSSYQLKGEAEIQLWNKPEITVYLAHLLKQNMADLIQQSSHALDNGKAIRALERVNLKEKQNRQAKSSPEETESPLSSNCSKHTPNESSSPDNDLSLILHNEAVQVIENNKSSLNASILAWGSNPSSPSKNYELDTAYNANSFYFQNACYYPIPMLCMYQCEQSIDEAKEDDLQEDASLFAGANEEEFDQSMTAYDKRAARAMRKPFNNITGQVLETVKFKEYCNRNSEANSDAREDEMKGRSNYPRRRKNKRRVARKEAYNWSSEEMCEGYSTGARRMHRQLFSHKNQWREFEEDGSFY
eukprot:TRINITY_DN7494_c0_g1_i2.p1 TRINITY_DN7494_c0_g1~~TRINITY_DN7494_c0_g1_i2.p1  ORF type:complete len:312 (-),score=71.95 TRINITY_DN7494_c0_g1_i2:142-1077(-)